MKWKDETNNQQKKQEATEINEDEQPSAVQNKSRQKKVGIVVAIIIFGMLLLGWLFYQKEKAARPMEDMTSKAGQTLTTNYTPEVFRAEALRALPSRSFTTSA